MEKAAQLSREAAEIRKDIIEMIHHAGSGHSGGSLSAAEIVTCLYGGVMRQDSADPLNKNRDRFILSKGHAAPLLYSVLSRHGYIDREELKTLRRIGSRLQGHPNRELIPGIELSTGSLGMGISAGLGMALAGKLTGRDYRVYVLCGDGELDEGQNWEAFMAMSKWRPENLTVIIDYNQVQLDGNAGDIMPMRDLEAKIGAFGLKTITCDGHDTEELLKAFEEAREAGEPAVIIAKTIKGKGVSFMEGKHIWHGKAIGEDEYQQAMKELDIEGEA